MSCKEGDDDENNLFEPERTLERWRWAGEGPAYMKIGGRVVYRIADIEAFEREVINATSDQSVPAY
ncbi:MAG: helix-turn-helix domain-containing protein [Parvularcula sp.]|nr:helix-turn-helix domain-containing protein [Parvularcula sp.]